MAVGDSSKLVGRDMYLNHWKLTKSPFGSTVDAALAYPSVALSEATARIDYLVNERRRLGVLLGERGLGKSVVLASAARALRQRGAVATIVDTVGISPQELIWRLANDWGGGPHPADEMFHLWRQVEDQLLHHQMLGKPTVLLVDDMGGASDEVMQQLVRLARLNLSPQARWTLLLAAEPEQLNQFNESLLHLIDLRIDLFGWDKADCIGYVQDALVTAGRIDPVFTDEALDRLAELSNGSPRSLAKLADFSLLGGAAAEVERIDAGVIDSAFAEISWTPTATATI